MSDPIQQLYETRVYPAMSHPLSDPAVSGVAAMLAGLRVPDPARARILEIGCGSGHNLIPLALRWPESRLAGIDLAAPAILAARELALAAGVENVDFQVADLRDHADAGEPFDFIIAHGFFSWVPDDVKAELLAFCRRNLSAEGIATISFNLESGWIPRFPVIEKVRAIQQAGAADEMAALAILRLVTEGAAELAIIDDMLAKGPAILQFDDFAPINDPWPLDRFQRVAEAAGLRWLGESAPGRNAAAGGDPDAWQTFHSAVLCRVDAPRRGKVSWDVLERIFLRPGVMPGRRNPVLRAIDAAGPACVSLGELTARLPELDRRELAMGILEGIRHGWLLPRMEAVRFESLPPECPALDRFRMECARRGLPLVDIWHRPCAFPSRHYEVLARMDGTRDQIMLEAFAKSHCPELDFHPWLRHLAARGFFT